jgi:hypothetical protein
MPKIVSALPKKIEPTKAAGLRILRTQIVIRNLKSVNRILQNKLGTNIGKFALFNTKYILKAKIKLA